MFRCRLLPTTQMILVLRTAFVILALLSFRVEGFLPSSVTSSFSRPKIACVVRSSGKPDIDSSLQRPSTISPKKEGPNVDLQAAGEEVHPPAPLTNTMETGELTEKLLIVTNTEDEREKYVVLGLLWIIAVISALDRVAMSVALVPMSSEFAFTDTVKGSISSLFSVGYGLAILPTGIVLSVLSPRNVMAFGIALWSLATLSTPQSAELLTVSLMAPLLFVRACVGAGESLVIPSTQKLLAVWTTSDEKGRAIAWIFSGFQAGTIAAYLLSPVVMDSLGGWRGLFYVYGAVGMLVLIPWMLFAKDTPTSSGRLIENGGDQPTGKATFDDALQSFKDAPWGDFLRSKGSWAMLLAHSAKNWGLYNSLAWTPTFYAEQYGIGVRESAWLSVLPSVAGAIGGFVAGTASDTILRNLNDLTVKSTTKVRKGFQAVGLLGPAIALGSLAREIPDEPWVAQFFLMAAIGLQSFNAAGFEGGNQDKAGPKWAGLLYSVTSLPAVMLGTFGVWATGRVLDLTDQDWSLVFSINAGVNVLGAVAFLLLFDSKREFD